MDYHGDVDHEQDDLRAEVARLLAAALESEKRHTAELQQRDRNHAADTERRQHEHDDEIRERDERQAAADERHADELRQRDHNHVADTERRQHEHDDELRSQEELHDLDVTNLRKALESRDEIGQAKGIIMATMRCTADEAFTLLKRQSQAENRKVTEIAAELTSRAARRQSPVEPPPTAQSPSAP
jgi:hypothetical protein